MKSVRALTRPGWALGLLAVVGFSCACFLILAPWQLHKGSAANARIDAINHPGPAAPLRDVQPVGVAADSANDWRLVTMSGHYLPDKQVILRRRSVDGQPAVEVVTAFRLDEGRTILVNRGYLLRDGDAAADAKPAPTVPTTIEGLIRPSEHTGRFTAAHVDDGELIAYQLDTGDLGRELALDVAPFSIQLAAHQPGALSEPPVPEPSAGPYRSYGFQWIAFGILAPLVLVWLAVSRLRADRAQPRTEATDVTTTRNTYMTTD